MDGIRSVCHMATPVRAHIQRRRAWRSTGTSAVGGPGGPRNTRCTRQWSPPTETRTIHCPEMWCPTPAHATNTHTRCIDHPFELLVMRTWTVHALSSAGLCSRVTQCA